MAVPDFETAPAFYGSGGFGGSVGAAAGAAFGTQAAPAFGAAQQPAAGAGAGAGLFGADTFKFNPGNKSEEKGTETEKMDEKNEDRASSEPSLSVAVSTHQLKRHSWHAYSRLDHSTR